MRIRTEDTLFQTLQILGSLCLSGPTHLKAFPCPMPISSVPRLVPREGRVEREAPTSALTQEVCRCAHVGGHWGLWGLLQRI